MYVWETDDKYAEEHNEAVVSEVSMTNAKAGDMYVKGFMLVLKPIFETPTVR